MGGGTGTEFAAAPPGRSPRRWRSAAGRTRTRAVPGAGSRAWSPLRRRSARDAAQDLARGCTGAIAAVTASAAFCSRRSLRAAPGCAGTGSRSGAAPDRARVPRHSPRQGGRRLRAAVVHVDGPAWRGKGPAPSRITAACRQPLKHEAAHAAPATDRAERLARLVCYLGVTEPGQRRARRFAAPRAQLFHALAERARIGRPLGGSRRPGAASATARTRHHPQFQSRRRRHPGPATSATLLATPAVDRAIAAILVSQVRGLLWARRSSAPPPDVDIDLLEDVFRLRAIPVDTQHHGGQMQARPLVDVAKAARSPTPAPARSRESWRLRSVQSMTALTIDPELGSVGRRGLPPVQRLEVTQELNSTAEATCDLQRFRRRRQGRLLRSLQRGDIVG